MEVFFFSGKKEKPKDDDIGGVYVSALSPLFQLLFSFLPLYLHTSAQPFSSASPPPRLVSRPAPGRVGVSPPGERAEKGLRPVALFQGKSGTKRQMTSRWHRYLLFRRLCFFFSFSSPSRPRRLRPGRLTSTLCSFFRGKMRTKRG